MAGRHIHRRASASRPHVHPHILHLRFPEEENKTARTVATPPAALPKSPSPRDQLKKFSAVLADEDRMMLRVIEVFPAKVDREGNPLKLEDCEWGLTASCLRRSRSTRLRRVLIKMLTALQEWDDYCRMREQSLQHTAHSPTITGKRRITELDKVKFDVELQRYQIRRNRKPVKISSSHFNRMLQLADSPQQREEIISWKMRSSLEFTSENDEGIKTVLDQSEQQEQDGSEGSSQGTPRKDSINAEKLPTATDERMPHQQSDSDEEDPGLSSVSSLATTTNGPSTPVSSTFQRASLKVDLRSLLGFGAHGRVYLGQLESTSFTRPKQVAVKKVEYSDKDPKRRSLLRSELAIWKSLAPSKYIVKYYGHLYNRKERCYSIVMEYCNFGSIQDLLNRLWSLKNDSAPSELFLSTGQLSKEALEEVYAASSCSSSEVGSLLSQTDSFPLSYRSDFPSCPDSNASAVGRVLDHKERPLLPYTTSRRVAAHLCRAVEFLHEQNIIHRDIKISNILLSPDGYLRLCDFGVSTKIRSENSIRNTCVGTPGYLAPEVIQERPHSVAADIWSVGCTIFELLSGKKPYSELNPGAVLIRTVTDPHPAIPAHLPSEAQSFLKNCLVQDPSARHTAAQLLSHPLLYPVVEPIIVD